MPRIISGSARGTHLAAPKGWSTRPTADRVKEALFSMLLPWWPAEAFLDLYAGTGQIGLEAASRGAGFTVLVEKNRDCQRLIRENCTRTHLEGKVRLMEQDAFQAVRQLLEEARPFDLIFADPPYRQALDVFLRLSGPLSGLLTPGGRIILEHDAHQAAPIVTNLQLERSCQYGMAMLSFYKGAVSDDQRQTGSPGPADATQPLP